MKEDSINERKSRDRDSVMEQVDKLEENFEELQVTVKDNLTELNKFKEDFLSRATEKTVSYNFSMLFVVSRKILIDLIQYFFYSLPITSSWSVKASIENVARSLSATKCMKNHSCLSSSRQMIQSY